jgi:predicted DNA-binding protein (UPF0251 family)
MARPKCPRQVNGLPGNRYFKPRGIPVSTLQEVVLTMDEFEAIRLADDEGLYQEQAAEKMNVSRQTFGRIVESAHKKIADVLINGKALKIDGGVIKMAEMRKFKCDDCGHEWELPFGTGRPSGCPSCNSKNFHRAEEDRGPHRNRRGRPFGTEKSKKGDSE